MTERQQLDIEHDALAGLEEDATADKPTDNALGQIAYLGEMLVRRQQEVNELSRLLKEAQNLYRQTAEVDLPEAMIAVGLRSFELADGTGIDVSDVLHCGIAEERRSAACAWLRNTGNDGIIKTQVAVAFGKGEYEHAMVLLDLIKGQTNYIPTLAETVHWQTLRAWIKEMMAEHPGELDEDLFGVYVRTVAEVRKEKKPRARKIK